MTRRGFLAGSACGMFTLAALGLPGEVSALPVFEAEAQAAGNERRYPVPTVDGATVDRASQVILVRYGAHIYAMSLVCPHENAAVQWLPRDGRFQCSKHSSRYTPDGTFTSGRATRNMDRFPVRMDGTQVVVTVDRVYQSDKDPAGWNAAVVNA
jgi:Rieske Fe-S protein